MLCFLASLQLSAVEGQTTSEGVNCETVSKIAVPKYRIGRKIGGGTTSDVFILFVSVKRSNISREKMMALSVSSRQSTPLSTSFI